MANLVDAIKKAAIEAQMAEIPMDVVYGTVKSVNPIKIYLDQKIILTSEFLTLTKNVTDYTTKITVDDELKECTIHNGLKVGDTVMMLKKHGGQMFVVIDKQ